MSFFHKKIKIGKQKIGRNYRSLIVAEISANHSQNLKKALNLIKDAKKAGANAIKIQTYKPESLSIKNNNDLKRNTTWGKYKSRYNLFSKTFLPWEWHYNLFELAKKLNLEIFSSPFDINSVSFLDKLNPVAYKIASPEINDLPLIEEIIKKKKPVIASLGCATKTDIDNLIKLMKKYNNRDLILLKCIADYPTDPKHLNLKTLKYLTDTYGCLVGFSDHTLGIGSSVASVTMGACIVEKHIKITNDKKSVDGFFSIDKNKFANMSKAIREAEDSVGKVSLNLGPNYKKHLNAKRSIYSSSNIKKGEIFTKENIRSVRPADGLEPKYLNYILGKKSIKKIKIGSPIKKSYIKY